MISIFSIQTLASTKYEKKKKYKNNKLKKSGPKGNEKFKLADGSYSVSDIQVYFEYIIKYRKPWLNKIYLNALENRIKFKIITRVLSPTFNAWNNEISWNL